MLTIDKLSIVHRRDLREIMRDFSLQLGPGDRAVLIGEEGDGKSTLLRLIRDPALVEGYVEWTGSVSPGGRCGWLPQEPGPHAARPDREAAIRVLPRLCPHEPQGARRARSGA